MRQSEESFADLRHHLPAVLRDISITDSTDPTEIDAARRQIHDSCEPLRRKVDVATKKSSVLATLRTGTTGFGVSALAAAGGFMVGGNLPSALASAGIAKSAESAIAHVREYKLRKKSERVADLLVAYFPIEE